MNDYVWIWVKNQYAKEMNNYSEKELRRYKVKEYKKNCVVLHNGKQYPYSQCFESEELGLNKMFEEYEKQIRAEVIDEYKDKLCSKLEEYQTGFNMVSMANVWHFSNEIAEQLKEQNSIIDSLKPKCSNEMPKDIVCNCTEEQKGD